MRKLNFKTMVNGTTYTLQVKPLLSLVSVSAAWLSFTLVPATAQTPEHGVVLPLNQAKVLLMLQDHKDIQSYWTPTLKEIRELEAHWKQVARLKPWYWLDGKKKLETVRKAMPDYYRQYVGFVRHNRKYIYVNAFRYLPPKEVNRDWHSNAIIVFDGGPNFFTVEYNVRRRRFAHLLWFLNP